MASFLDVLDPGVRAEPYGLYRRILDEAPVSEGPPGLYTFARYAHCAALLREPRLSSDERNGAVYQALLAAGQVSPADQELMASQPFLFRDPPDHTRLRRLVAKAFTPRVVTRLRPSIARFVDELLDAAGERGRLEVVADLAYPLPVVMICDLLGVPRVDNVRFAAWSRALARNLDPVFSLSPEELQVQALASSELSAYVNELVDRRRARPGDDLLSALIAVRERGEQLSRSDLVATVMLLLVAGHETTVNLIANGVLTLLRHPGVLDRLRAEPALAEGVVEEVLRYDPPVHFRTRVALQDLTIGGVTVPRGAAVVLLLGAANRDPARFRDPDRFDPARPDNRHLAFGGGIHFCLGAPLARVEGQIALAAFARRLVAPRLDDEPPRYHAGAALRSLRALPVTIRAALAARS